MVKVLFVCLGNICRSPMAEFIFKDMVKKEGFKNKFYIASAATSNEEFGNPVYPPAKKKLRENNISCEGKTAIQLKKSDYEKYDYIIAMEDRNIDNIMRIIKEDPEKKVFRILDFTNEPGNIADPWYTGDFDTAYDQIELGCRYLLNYIMNSTKFILSSNVLFH